MPRDLVQEVIKRSDYLFNTPERFNNERMWNELSEFMLNNQYAFFNGNTSTETDLSSITASGRGVKKTRRLYDSTSLQAVQDLSSAFQGTLTNSATKWSNLRFTDDDLNENEEAVKWLEVANNKIHDAFNESNFDTEIAKSYQSFSALANMALFHEEADSNDGLFGGFRFTALHLGKVAWTQNKDGLVDTLYRKITLTAEQAAQKWGDAISDNVRKALDENKDKEFEFLHAIFPRDKSQVVVNEMGLALPEQRPYANLYIDLQAKQIVEEGGYYEFPVHVARWSLLPAENYGRGPGHLALPDTRTLNTLKELALKAIAKQVDPPLKVEARAMTAAIDMRPGKVNVMNNINGIAEFVTQARNDVLQVTVEELKQSINSIFFLDKLLLPPRTETGEMTAFEISQRVEQMQRVLGPTLSRLNTELLQPLIVRAFKMMLRSGSLPEQPEVLKERGINVDVVFVNQLARAQQIQDVTTIQQWVQNLTILAQVKPEVLDLINSDGIARHTAEVLGVPEIAITDKRQVEDIREQRAQQQQQQAALESANLAADSASKLGLQNGQ